MTMVQELDHLHHPDERVNTDHMIIFISPTNGMSDQTMLNRVYLIFVSPILLSLVHFRVLLVLLACSALTPTIAQEESIGKGLSLPLQVQRMLPLQSTPNR